MDSSSDFYNAYKYIITKLVKSNGIENLSCKDKNKMLKLLRKNPLLVGPQGPTKPVDPTTPLIAIEAKIRMNDLVQRDAFIAASIAIQKAVRAEPGCMSYCFAADPVEPYLIQVYELWKDQKALAAHFEIPNYKTMLDLLDKFGVKSAVSKKHRIDASAPVYDINLNPTVEFNIEKL